jgi:hypothetical protein
MTDLPLPELTEDELLEQALAAVDQREPIENLPDPEDPAPLEPPVSASPTLQGLADFRRPKPETVCERCPSSVWFASATELKCYCRVMFLVVWSTKHPNVIRACDGMFLGQGQE